MSYVFKIAQKKHQTAVLVTISKRNERNELQATKVILNSCQFAIRKNYQCPLRSVAVRFSDTLLEQFFPLVNSVKPVNCEISSIWIAALQRQVDASTVYFSCIVHLHRYFCPIFRPPLLNVGNPYAIEMKYSGDVFEAVQSTHSTRFITVTRISDISSSPSERS